MTRRYHSLLVREDDRWAIQFGDYDLDTVKSERDDYRERGTKARDLAIVTTGDKQADIDARVAKMNTPKG